MVWLIDQESAEVLVAVNDQPYRGLGCRIMYISPA